MSKKRQERKKIKIEKEKTQKIKKFSKVFYLDKKVSQTPLELLENFKKTKKFSNWKKKAKKICKKRIGNKEGCEKIPLAYAGRLDPMACGKMLILAGEACKEKDKYLNLKKEYIFETLLGFCSDTKDILGIVSSDEDLLNKKFSFLDFLKFKKEIKKQAVKILGKKKMEYPHYSSKSVLGKPLFLWALEGKISEIEIPKKEVEIFKIKVLRISFISKENIEKEIKKRIGNLKKVENPSKELGKDFRRVEVLESWGKSLRDFPPKHKFILIKIKTKVTSGTYMRNLADILGNSLKTKGLAYSIKRTRFFKK